ncbi:hypothetical protein GCM10022251_00400 [Phytohabitans flavus]
MYVTPEAGWTVAGAGTTSDRVAAAAGVAEVTATTRAAEAPTSVAAMAVAKRDLMLASGGEGPN